MPCAQFGGVNKRAKIFAMACVEVLGRGATFTACLLNHAFARQFRHSSAAYV